ncbi:RNA polymerase sigma-70 factor, ECF subfamily [Saccharicrinis carchari]|uniref:RNA polymerase sigma factor n=1 Tax=Saccharicrinis carchari TaxID=1168039 RepID=A0A521D4M9_SACCC|nr:sigma-70 family RNA polymerase sigma factor [Saccharicrinis carchari]SMO66619.1 RNA polymerase sigma-70 factor, ECF subfamily [Saccharicrinis carchari]
MNDIELVNQIKQGNPSAYRYLVSKHQRLVFSIAYRIASQNQTDTEDIAQDVFIKVYKNIKNYRAESKLSTWIASIAWKTSIDFVRKKSRAKINFTDEPQNYERARHNLTRDNLNQSDMVQVVKSVLSNLPGHYQSVLSLFYLEEFSLAEIHDISGMPIGTIKSYLSRARGMFRNEIEKLYGKDAIEMLYEDK